MTVEQYNQLVDNYADKLYRFACKSCRNKDLGKDLVQDTFEKVWKKRESIPFKKGKSYLFTTIYHAIVDWSRSEKRKQMIPDFLSDPGSQNNAYSDLNQILHQALEQLPTIQRTVILLRDYEGYSYQEIANISELSMEQVKVYIFRARKALKIYLVSMEKLI